MSLDNDNEAECVDAHASSDEIESSEEEDDVAHTSDDDFIASEDEDDSECECASPESLPSPVLHKSLRGGIIEATLRKMQAKERAAAKAKTNAKAKTEPKMSKDGEGASESDPKTEKHVTLDLPEDAEDNLGSESDDGIASAESVASAFGLKENTRVDLGHNSNKRIIDTIDSNELPKTKKMKHD